MRNFQVHQRHMLTKRLREYSFSFAAQDFSSCPIISVIVLSRLILCPKVSMSPSAYLIALARSKTSCRRIWSLYVSEGPGIPTW